MQNLLLITMLLALSCLASAQREVEIWPNGAPGAKNNGGSEKVRIYEPTGDHIISNVHRPSITVFLPEKPTGTGALVLPGGGHAELWFDHEGVNIAKALNQKGIAAFVLKYRLAREQGSTYTVEKDALADSQRAMRLIKSRSRDYGVDPGRVGIIGFSAGGELAWLTASRFEHPIPSYENDHVDELSARPAFQGLIYPGASFQDPIPALCPPAFLLAGADDSISDRLLPLYQKLKQAGVPADLHILAGVGHGFGIRKNNPPHVALWIDQFTAWLDYIGMLKGSQNPPAQGQDVKASLSQDQQLTAKWIPPGKFQMGSPDTEVGRKPDEGPRREITLSKGFWLGQTEVTIGQWKAVMGDTVREHLTGLIADDTKHMFGDKEATLRDYMGFKPGSEDAQLKGEAPDLPMYFVIWQDAANFCQRLTDREHQNGHLPFAYAYCLPTEAQWEYAARAGTTTATYNGDLTQTGTHDAMLDPIAWYAGSTPTSPHVVATKLPNHWGLCDMAGSMWEWCRDWYGPVDPTQTVDPVGPVTGTGKVNRGGSWGSWAPDERSAARAQNPPAEASAYRGFRVALCLVG